MKDLKTARLALNEVRAALDNAIDKMNQFASTTHSVDVLDEKLEINKIERKLIKKYNDWAIK